MESFIKTAKKLGKSVNIKGYVHDFSFAKHFCRASGCRNDENVHKIIVDGYSYGFYFDHL